MEVEVTYRHISSKYTVNCIYHYIYKILSIYLLRLPKLYKVTAGSIIGFQASEFRLLPIRHWHKSFVRSAILQGG